MAGDAFGEECWGGARLFARRAGRSGLQAFLEAFPAIAWSARDGLEELGEEGTQRRGVRRKGPYFAQGVHEGDESIASHAPRVITAALERPVHQSCLLGLIVAVGSATRGAIDASRNILVLLEG